MTVQNVEREEKLIGIAGSDCGLCENTSPLDSQLTSRFFRLQAPSLARTFYQSSNSPSRTNAALIFTMKYSSAVLLCALLAAFLVLTTAAEESLEEEGRAHFESTTGCPDVKACTKNCKKLGHHLGTCLPRLNVCVCV
ncbi:hypothetical protein MTO96_048784 [Rhipicephalus appendiculatus]